MNTLLETAVRVFAPGIATHLPGQVPPFIESNAQGAYLYNAEGAPILDGHTGGGIYNLGRRPPELVRALQLAAKETDQGNFVLISREKADTAKAIADFMPGSLSCSYFTVVRGEAMEVACKLARGKTKQPGLVCFKGAFHGDTGFALSLSDLPEKSAYGPLIPEIQTLPFNSLDRLERVIDSRTAAVVLETVQVENGCIRADENFLKMIRQRCDETGTLLIMDETRTGFGRTGYKFAWESFGIEPDILVYGEAICGGMFNMCGLAFTPGVKTFFDDHPLIHLCTFGGHDIGCRVAIKSLEHYEQIKPWEKTAEKAPVFTTMLKQAMTGANDKIAAIQSSGLAGALVFKSPELADIFCRKVLELGLLVMPGRINKASVIIRPPLIIDEAEMEILGKILKKGAGSL